MKKNFVTFYSAGTFFAEETTKPINFWDVPLAVSMAQDVKERYGATPYGFRFSTRERGEDELDSRVTETSPFYYLGGEVLTLEQVKSKMPDEKILISNMENNDMDRIIINKNSWRVTLPLRSTDIVLQYP